MWSAWVFLAGWDSALSVDFMKEPSSGFLDELKSPFLLVEDLPKEVLFSPRLCAMAAPLVMNTFDFSLETLAMLEDLVRATKLPLLGVTTASDALPVTTETDVVFLEVV